MGKVYVSPMPERFRKVPKLYRPRPGPIFRDFGNKKPSADDVALAKELFMLLDNESKSWYLETMKDFFSDL